MGLHRGGKETEVRGVGQQVLVQRRDVRQLAVGTEPEVLHRFVGLRVVGVVLGDRTNLDGLRIQQLVADALGNPLGALAGQLQFRRQIIRANHLGHLDLVVETFLVVLEGAAQGEDRLAFLDRGDPAGAEAAAVAHPVHLVHHRHAGVAGTQEVAVHGVYVAIVLHRLAGRRQRLPQDLAAIELAEAEILAHAPEQVLLDGFQAQQSHQVVQYLGHGVFPRIRAVDGLVAAHGRVRGHVAKTSVPHRAAEGEMVETGHGLIR